LERRRGHGDRGWWCSQTPRQAALQARGKAGRDVTGGDRGELVGGRRFDVDDRGAGERVAVERLGGLEAAAAVGWEMEEKGQRCGGFL
jgi:hypothetical protein